MKDYRLKANRLESFERYYVAQLKSNDIDPAYATLNWLFEKYNSSKEQQYWMSFLYGVTYELDSVAYICHYFPDYPPDLNKLQQWHTINWRRLVYESDRIHCKGHLVEMVQSYMDLVGKSQVNFFESFIAGNPMVDFDQLWDKLVRNLLSFGRYSTFFYTETLKRCCKLPIECSDLMLGKDGSSHTAGLMWVLGVEELEYEYSKWTPQLLAWMDKQANRLLEGYRDKYPELQDWLDYWSLETSLCAYKGIYRRNRYHGYYIDRGLRDHIRFKRNLEIPELMYPDLLDRDETYIKDQWSQDEADFWDVRQEIHPLHYLGEMHDWDDIRVKMKDVMMDSGELVDVSPYVLDGTYDRHPAL
jgi:hypothetical protein